MHRFRFAACSLFLLVTCLPTVRAEEPSNKPPVSPLRLLPEQTDLLVRVPQPRRLVETLTTLETFQQLQQLAPIREYFDSTNVRRLLQMVAYFEKELGAPWPQLLDHLAAHGAMLGVKFGDDPAPVLLVIQGDDEKLMRRFFELGQNVLEEELARQDAREQLVKGSQEGVQTVRIGTGFHAAVAGATLFVSNSGKALNAGLERCRNQDRKSLSDEVGVAEADKLLPENPLISVWLNMKTVPKSAELKASYQPAPRDDPIGTVLIGHYLDLLGRTPFVTAGLFRDPKGLAISVRLPRGREDMGADKLLHVSPAGRPGSRPLLEPKNVLYSESDYFDIANVWNERAKLFNDKQVKALEAFDKKSAVPLLLTGIKISRSLPQMGSYFRLVAVHQAHTDYKKSPKIVLPAFALTWELREPEAFGKSAETLLRAAALLGGLQTSLKLTEEKYQDCKLIGYRFAEDQPLKGDVNDLRFNFTPCFTRVGDQLVLASTVELCRELVDLLRKEGTSPTRGDDSTARIRLYSSGVASYLRTLEDLLVTQIALDQAVTPKEARERVRTFLDVIGHLGALSMEPRFNAKSFQYDIRLRPHR